MYNFIKSKYYGHAERIFKLGVLTDLKARGVEDALVTDNLSGFTDTIKSVFPESTTQICVVHQIRNACRYVVWKEKKEFTSDMKLIYNAPTKESASYVSTQRTSFHSRMMTH